MELQEFIANFAAQFEKTDTTEFTNETISNGLDEWISIKLLSVIRMVKGSIY